jgi:hypothetical protein
MSAGNCEQNVFRERNEKNNMDDFETSVGYRSIWLDSSWPSKAKVRKLPYRELVQLARDHFDFSLAEILRSTGEWHWNFDENRIGDIASEIAEHLSTNQQGWNDLYGFLHGYYQEQYRTPSDEEVFLHQVTQERERKGGREPMEVIPFVNGTSTDTISALAQEKGVTVVFPSDTEVTLHMGDRSVTFEWKHLGEPPLVYVISDLMGDDRETLTEQAQALREFFGDSFDRFRWAQDK